MRRITLPVIIAATLGPIQSVAGWLIAASLTPNYDPVRQTISELAAAGAPAQMIQSGFFVLGGTLTLVVAIFASAFPIPARIALFVSALCTYGLTIFPTPLHGSSTMHRLFAISSFVISAGWPLLAMQLSKTAPLILRPLPILLQTLFQTVIAVAFLFVWADPNATNVGVWERVVTTAQALQVSVIVFGLLRFQTNTTKAGS